MLARERTALDVLNASDVLTRVEPAGALRTRRPRDVEQ
jgi:hypothetical protein